MFKKIRSLNEGLSDFIDFIKYEDDVRDYGGTVPSYLELFEQTPMRDVRSLIDHFNYMSEDIDGEKAGELVNMAMKRSGDVDDDTFLYVLSELFESKRVRDIKGFNRKIFFSLDNQLKEDVFIYMKEFDSELFKNLLTDFPELLIDFGWVGAGDDIDDIRIACHDEDLDTEDLLIALLKSEKKSSDSLKVIEKIIRTYIGNWNNDYRVQEAIADNFNKIPTKTLAVVLNAVGSYNSVGDKDKAFARLEGIISGHVISSELEDEMMEYTDLEEFLESNEDFTMNNKMAAKNKADMYRQWSKENPNADPGMYN